MESTIKPHEEFEMVESVIDKSKGNLKREKADEHENDFMAAESTCDYDDLSNFEISVAIAETETDEIW